MRPSTLLVLLVGGAAANPVAQTGVATPKGYQQGVSLGKKAINAPTQDCEGNPTYIGVKTFTEGPFSVARCAAACTETSDWNRAHPHVWSKKTGLPRVCQMFNTYILYNGKKSTGQVCAMYDQTWSTSFATNSGQWRGRDFFSMDRSYMFSNTTGAADQPQSCNNPTRPGSPSVPKCTTSQYWDGATKTCALYPTCDAETQWLNKETKACVSYPTCDAEAQWLNKETKACVQYPTCNPDSEWLDKQARACVQYPTCNPDSQSLNKETHACVDFPTCNTDTQWFNRDTISCVDYPVCNTDTQWLNKETLACIDYPSCDTVTEWLNKETKACVQYPTCDLDTQSLNKETHACMDFPTCNADTQWFNRDTITCVDYPRCNTDTQWLNKDTRACVDYPVCTPVTQWLNKDTKRCVFYPRCSSLQYLNTQTKLCANYPSCNSDTEFLDKTQKACVPWLSSCPATTLLERTTNTCEVPAPNSCGALSLAGSDSYSSADGRSWNLKGCDYWYGGPLLLLVKLQFTVPAFQSCLDACAETENCAKFGFYTPTKGCYLWPASGNISGQEVVEVKRTRDPGWVGAILA